MCLCWLMWARCTKNCSPVSVSYVIRYMCFAPKHSWSLPSGQHCCSNSVTFSRGLLMLQLHRNLNHTASCGDSKRHSCWSQSMCTVHLCCMCLAHHSHRSRMLGLFLVRTIFCIIRGMLLLILLTQVLQHKVMLRLWCFHTAFDQLFPHCWCSFRGFSHNGSC